ncbi:MAG: hypothetical protein J2P47_04135 [Acetobacteraceae bacterium]|nr:hypothetical protein [Acetobacteraceae bacterium]
MRPLSQAFLLSISLLSGANATALGQAAPLDPGLSRTSRDEAAAAAAFEEVWRIVRDRFYDPKLRGLDWDAVGRRYRAAAVAAPGPDARAAVINRMLDELHASHTELFTQDQTAFYELADIFARSLQNQGLSRLFPAGRVEYPGIGILTHRDEAGRDFVIGVIPGAPATRSGLLAGDEIVAADGAPFREVGSFRGKIGRPVQLAIRRKPDQPPHAVTVVPEAINPSETFLRGLEEGARVISAPNGSRIGYVRVWSYASWRYQDALERLVSTGPLKDTDALILDLRDGWGGAQSDYLDLFSRDTPALEVIGRSGRSHLEATRWRKPAAMLVNQGTRSGKEVLADGFRNYELGPLIGTRTAGAVLAASAFLISDGSLLLLALDDVRVDGHRLEGVGVEPTIAVPFDIRYAAGADPQLDRAVQELAVIAQPR